MATRMPKRPLLLTGMMGVGKSTVGPLVAERLGVPFLDLDRAIEAAEGRSIATIFAEEGEATFRALEKRHVRAVLDEGVDAVVALGGGALLDRALRLEALARATVVTLSASIEELRRRTRRDDGRPLLAGSDEVELRARLAALAASRAAVYAETHATIDTTDRPPAEVAVDVERIASRPPIAVPLGERSYVVDVTEPGGLAEALGGALGALAPTRVVHVTDDVVDGLVGTRLDDALRAADPRFVKVVLPTGERHKTLASVETILRAAVEAPVDRGAVLVAVGGGVVTDMGGLAAALALRGIRWIAVPTTLLAMVDASVGGKTAVDLGAAKNAVGAFHQPSRVIVDPSVATSEGKRALSSGLAEVVKSALVGDADLFATLVRDAEKMANERDPALLAAAVRASIAVKAAIVGRDERESGERMHLNFGHTIGHALEAQGGFERLTHGEAVALGTVAALRIGVALGQTPPDLLGETVALLERLGLPAALDAEPLAEALAYVGYDKKRAGSAVRFVVVRAPSVAAIVSIPVADLPGLLGVGR